MLQPVAGRIGLEGVNLPPPPVQRLAQAEVEADAGFRIAPLVAGGGLHRCDVLIGERAGVNQGDSGQRRAPLGRIGRGVSQMLDRLGALPHCGERRGQAETALGRQGLQFNRPAIGERGGLPGAQPLPHGAKVVPGGRQVGRLFGHRREALFRTIKSPQPDVDHRQRIARAQILRRLPLQAAIDLGGGVHLACPEMGGGGVQRA